MSIKPICSEFLSSNGENPIITTTWLPEGEPVGVVQLVHGMHEHMGRYDVFARFLCQNGFIVAGHDHLGHGKTALRHGAFGYFGDRHGAKTLVSDSNILTLDLSTSYPHLPLFLLGHSMGSFISRLQVLSTHSLLKGYICMGTGNALPISPYICGLSSLLCQINGKDTSSVVIANAMNKLFGVGLDKNEVPDAWISHDPTAVESYVNDPLARFYFTNQGYRDLMDLQIASNRPEWYHRMNPDLSILLVAGMEDPVGGMGKDVPIIRGKLVSMTKTKDVSYRLFSGMRHEILNEVHREESYQHILDWIIQHIDQPSETMEAHTL